MGLFRFVFIHLTKAAVSGRTNKITMTAIHFGLIITAALLQGLVAQEVEVQHVQLSDTVSMSCNLSYAYGTSWLKHNAHAPPTLVVFASFSKGDTIYEYRPDSRISVVFVNRSLILSITDIEENDLGLYFCAAHLNTGLLIGSGTVLEGPFQFGFCHWYCTAVGGGLLSMVICVCVIHWKTEVHRKTALREEEHSGDKNKCDIFAVPLGELATSRESQLSESV